MSAPTSRYVYATNPHDLELERLRLLEARYDPVTRDRLRVVGPLTGARCLEVGAGAGSVARMLAALVGPTGLVVATDADPRFLRDVQEENIEVWEHDILNDDLEAAAFDVVHCRALLRHLPRPERVLARMAAALRPGGWLLVEDADFTSFAAADPDHPLAATFDRLTRATVGQIVGEMDVNLGARLPALVDGLGLVECGAEALSFLRQGGSAESRFIAQSSGPARARLLQRGVTAAEFDAVLAAMDDPSFSFVDSLNVAAWGRRPVPPYLG
jgi:SAM-dependent methyltransferase